ncbi:head-tail connector protein [Lachnospiraceae bacterium KK002]
MAVTLEEMKNYLRVDYDDDDALIESMVRASEKICMGVARMDDTQEFYAVENAEIAVQYTVAYLYEHREDADHHAMMLTLRALLSGSRKEAF